FRDRRLSLVHRLGPRHDDQPGGAHAADGARGRSERDLENLRERDSRRLAAELVPRRRERRLVPHRRGAPGFQLTWMDAKVGEWVVTPRRGKAVEINALWYNALCLLADWHRSLGRSGDGVRFENAAAQARDSFNRRFWHERAGHLLDVVDGESGDDAACRPNQVIAISLAHPVLAQCHWQRVLRVVR